MNTLYHHKAIHVFSFIIMVVAVTPHKDTTFLPAAIYPQEVVYLTT